MTFERETLGCLPWTPREGDSCELFLSVHGWIKGRIDSIEMTRKGPSYLVAFYHPVLAKIETRVASSAEIREYGPSGPADLLS